MNPSEVEAVVPERPGDADTSLDRQTPKLRQQWSLSLQPEFQDSNLSPALPLLPTNNEGEPHLTEYSLFQQSGGEFVPLRPYPDISMASEKFKFAPQNFTTQASEHELLSQYPLMQATLLSEGEGSCCSLSQHSFSPLNESRPTTTSHSSNFLTTERKESPVGRNVNPVTDPQNHPEVEAEDEAYFLNKEIPAQHLLKLLQKDIGMLTESSSPGSSASVASGKMNSSVSEGLKSSQTFKQTGTPHEPACEVPLSQQQKEQSDRDWYCDQSWSLPSEASNISMGPRSTQPDHSSEALHRRLLKETEPCNASGAETEKQRLLQSVTPHLTEVPQEKPSDTRRVLHTGPFSVGVERGYKERHLWVLGNQTDIDGSYLGFLPQSQSTPGVFKAPSKSSVKAKAEQLSAIESSKEDSCMSEAGISPQSRDHRNKESKHGKEKAASAQVPSLPSVGYMQKVDAWRANQTSGSTSLLDSLALQGFSGVSPKKRAYDAISDTLNRLLSQKVRSLQQPPVAAHQGVSESSSMVPPGSSLKRGREDVVPSIPGEMNTGYSKGPYGLLSQSHSSLSTVVSDRKDQGTQSCAENEKSVATDHIQQNPNPTAQLSALFGLGRFSDVSADHDLKHSNSQDSSGSGIKLGASIGASSVVSLDVDNYAPYWTSKPSTPPPQPQSRELNIEERIPLYLHNLGIDQSPSTILNPFVPRGPIREPEFSPTDLCTIKGSIGTPTKSTQPSEGGSPNKGEFSGCSVMSVDSSMSITLSLDSLGPGASIPEEIMQPSASDTEDNLPPSSPQPDEDSYPSTLQTTLQQQRDSSLTSSQNTIQVGDRFGSDVSLSTEGRDSVLSSRSSTRDVTDMKEASVKSKQMLELCDLLTQADNVLSAGAFVVSSEKSRILSDENFLLSMRNRNTDRRESSFSSPATLDNRSQSFRLWARSSSDSMLTSEVRQNTELESKTSSQVPNDPSATASCRRQENGIVGKGVGSSFVLSQSVRRTEPEGCSAAPPDSAAPPQPAPTSAPAPGPPQPAPPEDLEEEEQAAVECPEHIATPLLKEESDQGVMSDGSSRSSLAVKVTKLLQTESPATVVSSTSSMTDQEERKAREWIKLKVSGQHCEPLELHEEDRRRIEEIKKELMRNPVKFNSVSSSDTESTSSSSFRFQRELDPVQEAEIFITSKDAVTKQTQTLGSHGTGAALSMPQLQNLSYPDLEAQIREIAAREGVTLTRTNQPTFTSITIASRRRSTSPTPSASPAPELLHLSELSTVEVDGKPPERLPPTTEEQKEAEPASVLEPSSLLYQSNSQVNPGNQTRQGAIGGHLEEALLPSEDSGRQQDTQGQSCGHQEALPVQHGCVPTLRAEEAAAPSVPESPAQSGHVSHVHLTLLPRTRSRSPSPLVTSPQISSGSAPTPKELVPVRLGSATSPDEGVGLTSPPEWCRSTELMRRPAAEREDTCTLYRASEALRSQPFKDHRAALSARPQTAQAPVLPVLLPYKPSGSEDFFYVPQAEADLSSDTTMESSHPGSDDAVPPRFSSDVLGSGAPGISRGVTIRHTEGIYSRRMQTSTFHMREHDQRAESTSQTQGSRPLQPSSPAPRAAVMRDQGTSPVPFLSSNQSEVSHGRFQPIYEDVGHEKSGHPFLTNVVSQFRDQDPPPPQSSVQHSSSPLDQLWERFCTRWNLEDSHPTSDGEASLLERLERLSRLIHDTRGNKAPGAHPGSEEGAQRRTGGKKDQPGEPHWTVREGRETYSGSAPPQAWRIGEPSEPSNNSFTSTSSHDGPRHQDRCPADQDETDTMSTSGSFSTVDTARLVRAFGSHRVLLLKTSSSLRKLYSTIDEQKERQEQRGGRGAPEEHLSSLPEDSTVTPESMSSISISTPPSHHGPSRTLTAKRAVKVANKGVQAGDLELIYDVTRRHTRDVGTTFPSPAEFRPSRQTSSSSSSLDGGRGGWNNPSKTQKRRKSKKSPSKIYSQGVSWFIPVEELKAEGRKENYHEQMWRPSTYWFEPYSRNKPWREPLRQRRAPEDENKPSSTHHELELRLKPAPSASAGLSLQDALATRRPDFICQSRQRLKRLALQVEERKLQEVFIRRTEEHFSRPGGAAGQPKPAGTTRRAVPRKEMIQRSKLIYNNLPEVRKRREEERRRAQYDSYRLNAQLYNKRITSHVLGRRTAWQ